MHEPFYILEGTTVKQVDQKGWENWWPTSDRMVARDTIGESSVSTVFLGVDHGVGLDEPLLFETLVFGGPLKDSMTRCSTYEEALVLHKVMCDRVRMELP